MSKAASNQGRKAASNTPTDPKKNPARKRSHIKRARPQAHIKRFSPQPFPYIYKGQGPEGGRDVIPNI